MTMREAASSALILAVTMNFLALGTSNLKACIRAAALQGLFVSVFPVLFTPAPSLRLLGLVIVAGIVKARTSSFARLPEWRGIGA